MYDRDNDDVDVSDVILTRYRELPPFGFVRLPAVLRVFPVSRSAWLNGVKSGEYPASVKLAPRTIAWRVEDIRALIEKTSNQDKA
ncbi:MAG: AlpA family phage regulatory protein [Gammaproteobacteria bacterium]